MELSFRVVVLACNPNDATTRWVDGDTDSTRWMGSHANCSLALISDTSEGTSMHTTGLRLRMLVRVYPHCSLTPIPDGGAVL